MCKKKFRSKTFQTDDRYFQPPIQPVSLSRHHVNRGKKNYTHGRYCYPVHGSSIREMTVIIHSLESHKRDVVTSVLWAT